MAVLMKPVLKSSFKKESGFTLIETLIYTFILGLFLLLVTQVFISVKVINANSKAMISVQNNFRQVMADISVTVRGAQEVSVPVPGGSGQLLSLNGGQIFYELGTQGELIKNVSGIESRVTTNEVVVSNLTFSNPVEADQTGTVLIQMEITSNYVLTGDRQLSEILEFAIGVR
ncbi:prepilin-type N-terminal cleavage/methylation domain-containing protein [Patescibacteria group bacterium]|nr:prepilin-type N-terminal cleavage/methylation domain-containing protein [Patescibacteria group bacterium]